MDRETINFKELVEAYDRKKKIPDGTPIIIKTSEFSINFDISEHNNIRYLHKETGRYLHVVYHDDFGNWANYYLVMPDETLEFIADDEEDDVYYSKMDKDNSFYLEYNLQLN